MTRKFSHPHRFGLGTMLLLLAVQVGTSLAGKPYDLKGWGKVRWGMTSTDVRQEYPLATLESHQNGNGGGIFNITLHGVEAYSLGFKAEFLFDYVANFKQHVINLWRVQWTSERMYTIDGFANVRKAAIVELGSPDSDQESPFSTEELWWLFP